MSVMEMDELSRLRLALECVIAAQGNASALAYSLMSGKAKKRSSRIEELLICAWEQLAYVIDLERGLAPQEPKEAATNKVLRGKYVSELKSNQLLPRGA